MDLSWREPAPARPGVNNPVVSASRHIPMPTLEAAGAIVCGSSCAEHECKLSHENRTTLRIRAADEAQNRASGKVASTAQTRGRTPRSGGPGHHPGGHQDCPVRLRRRRQRLMRATTRPTIASKQNLSKPCASWCRRSAPRHTPRSLALLRSLAASYPAPRRLVPHAVRRVLAVTAREACHLARHARDHRIARRRRPSSRSVLPKVSFAKDPAPLVGPQTSARRNDEWKRLRVPDPAASAERPYRDMSHSPTGL
jgi:hypothetical protein